MTAPKGFRTIQVIVPVTYQVIMMEVEPQMARSIEVMSLEGCDTIDDAIAKLEKFQDGYGFGPTRQWDIDRNSQRATWQHDEALVIIIKEQ